MKNVAKKKNKEKAAEKIAVVLFNLGAPNNLSSVRPFLRNLFLDPAIIRLPWVFRLPLALLISTLRSKTATPIYQALGGSSPLLSNTEQQARALEKKLNTTRKEQVRTFVAMRYWHPMSKEVVEKVRRWQPDRVLLAPLYPQFSSSTTASSLKQWRRQAAKKISCETRVLCCYPTEAGFIQGICRAMEEPLKRQKTFEESKPLRILFSAHGIPQEFVDRGDPYQYHVEQTVAAVVRKLALPTSNDWRLCYQSRVGAMRWLQPYTETEIRRAGAEQRPILVVPVAFVSEHSETLYELDREYLEVAIESGVPVYLRASTVGIDNDFIGGLARAINQRLDQRLDKRFDRGINQGINNGKQAVAGLNGKRLCPKKFTDCPCVG